MLDQLKLRFYASYNCNHDDLETQLLTVIGCTPPLFAAEVQTVTPTLLLPATFSGAQPPRPPGQSITSRGDDGLPPLGGVIAFSPLPLFSCTVSRAIRTCQEGNQSNHEGAQDRCGLWYAAVVVGVLSRQYSCLLKALGSPFRPEYLTFGRPMVFSKV